jgi:methylated-DNA-[protein]-cysteine S-methyltransferase
MPANPIADRRRVYRRAALDLTNPPVRPSNTYRTRGERNGLMSTTHTTIETPLGELTLVADDGVLSGVYFPGHWTRPDRAAFGERSDRGFEDVERQLAEYFAGDRTSFDLPTSAGGDAFERRVWALIAEIPFGQTTTYGEIARELGDPTLAREVGVAVGRNPLSLIVPCHRVVGKNGKLTGYAGGLRRKQFLLDLEGVPSPSDRVEESPLVLF